MLGKPVPDFSLPSTGGSTFRSTKGRGTTLVLYFYPKDNTPGCTQQGSDIRDQGEDEVPVRTLTDAGETVCTLFGMMKMKNMYRRKVRGIERSTFVIDEKRRVVREWRGVKVPGHVQEVLNFVKAL
jgi:peroxiredoxin Q/BCP